MLYLRHADKQYANGNSKMFPLDPGITKKGKEKIITLVPYYIKKYGTPSTIISSPYYRTRQTTSIIASTIYNITGKTVNVSYDSIIGEYLGHQKIQNIATCLRPETLSYAPIYLETWEQYITRITEHKQDTENSKNNIWYVTHGLLIQSISSLYGKKIEYPGSLQGFYIDNGDIIIE